ncbi:uncharacterized protein LOC108218711 isoform X3 [Daucus carota subsp. sativus]|uniref:uncharacterized protein LOC108218711 isoform X3 n=1 Tax=Daucus carota subsp. sativus TaxID=79200 RepID=UPI0007B2FD4F|nr:PREDICTED: endoplasmic reticulum metallopeptidase 1 isoform X2 [Daucus carota subsp. sativus]
MGYRELCYGSEVSIWTNSGSVVQDLFSSGVIKSATDFQVYKEVAGLSGLDFAYVDTTAVYHTKNDKLKLLTSGSLQHLGENMLAFLQRAGASSYLSKMESVDGAVNSGKDSAIYFDILGTYMIVYRQRLASMLHNSVILQSLLIWGTSVVIGGYPAAISLALSFLSVLLMWICSVSFSVLVAFVLPFISTSPVPFISSPWLVVGLFVCPSLLGALAGQHLGFIILKSYLTRIISRRNVNLSPVLKADLIKLDAERWLYKAGLLQWLVLLMIGNFYKIGSSYIALVWLVSPAFSYGLLEATLSPARLPKPLKTITLLLGLLVPFLISSGMFVRLAATLIGTAVRFERNPGGTPEWLGSVILAVYIAAVVCLTLVYLLSYVHISGAKTTISIATCILFGLSVAAVLSGIVPAFTEDIARTVNVVHVVDTTGIYEGKEASSYISLFSSAPGKLTKEAEIIGEGFVCGRDKKIDFVTFSVQYGCWTQHGIESGWSKSDIPILRVENDNREDNRITEVIIDTKLSTRWSLAINTNEIEDFRLRDVAGNSELIMLGEKSSVDGWHIIQFSGGKNTPTKFSLTLFWAKRNIHAEHKEKRQGADQHLLLKLRTDLNRITPMAKTVISKLPPWCSLFGKSTSPFTLAFISSLPVNF